MHTASYEFLMKPKESAPPDPGEGYRVGQGFHFRLFHKQCGGGHRYTYFFNWVARMRPPPTLNQALHFVWKTAANAVSANKSHTTDNFCFTPATIYKYGCCFCNSNEIALLQLWRPYKPWPKDRGHEDLVSSGLGCVALISVVTETQLSKLTAVSL